MIWKKESFINNYEKYGYGMMLGKFSTYPSSKYSSYIIKDSTDLIIAQNIIRSKKINKTIKYDKLVERI